MILRDKLVCGRRERITSRRGFVLALGGAVLASPLVSFAQQQGKVSRIGFLAMLSRSTASNPDVYYDAFMQGMRVLGYVEGSNLAIEWRFAEGRYERLPELARELVEKKVQVIVTHSTPGTRAAQQATSTIPVVTAAVIDPVGSGFAASLSRPGRNITGLSVIGVDLSPKRLELLKTMVPGLSRVAMLVNPGNPANPPILRSIQEQGRHAGIEIVPVEARTAEDIARGFTTMASKGAQAVVIGADGFFLGRARQIAELGLKDRVITMSPWREHVAAGAVMSYGQNVADSFHRAATFVDKILKGAKPEDLPFEEPTRIHLAINRKTAQALGVSVPRELLLRADELIE